MNNLKLLFSNEHLVPKIAAGIVLGIAIGLLAPNIAASLSLLGALFVKALKAIAPLLVFTLVVAAVAAYQRDSKITVAPVLGLYAIGTLTAALIAVGLSFVFPISLELNIEAATANAPENLTSVLQTPVFQLFDNPVNALLGGNYIALILWATGLGIGLQTSASTTKQMVTDLASAITSVVRFIICTAPYGVFGLVAGTVAATGISALLNYASLLFVLLAAMFSVALIVNPIIVGVLLKQNPYPLVFQCLKESGITAFFTRSSAANIPVNIALCKRENVSESLYSVTIPLGASINMAGAAITISVLSLAAAHTMGVEVSFIDALVLCVVAAVSACGASGVAGGSLLLIPLACSLLGISQEVAMQVVAIGFIIGVVQDSAETALNSSTDALFTIAYDRAVNAKAD